MIRTLFFTILCLGVFSFPAQALTVRQAGLDEITEHSQNILLAKVLQKQMLYDQDQSGRVVYEYTLQILDVIKGDLQQGELHDFKQMASGRFFVSASHQVNQPLGFPEYTEGKTYLFFLPEPHPISGLLAPVAIHQGFYQVETNQQGQVIVPSLNHRLPQLLRHNVSPNQSQWATVNLSKNKTWTYKQFKNLIQAAQD